MKRKTILVADDDPDLRLALELRLAANRYRVVQAADGTSTIEQAQQTRPDLILLDLGMPAGDGFSVMESLKKDRETAGIPIIVLTGRDRRGNLNPALDGGAQVFLQKPVESVRLLNLIQRELTPSRLYSY